MSFEKAKEYAQKIPKIGEAETAMATIEALEAMGQTVNEARSVIQGVGLEIGGNLRSLGETGERTITHLNSLGQELGMLNSNLRRIDATTTDLGKKANRLAFWLVILTAVLATPVLAQYGPKLFEVMKFTYAWWS